jgi:hypothetical protein
MVRLTEEDAMPPLTQTAHGLTLTITPPKGPQRGQAGWLLGILSRGAHALGITILSARTGEDGRAHATVALPAADTRRPLTAIAPALDPLPLLAAILYHPLPASLIPAGHRDRDNLTPVAMLYRAAMLSRSLPLEMAMAGIASQRGADPLALSLCPALLASAGLLPAGMEPQAALTRLSYLLGCGHGRVRVGNATIHDTILIPAQLVRALISQDGTPPPHPAADALVA